MATRIKKITLKKMSAKDFAVLLKKLGACSTAREWAKGKTLRKVWGTCPQSSWLSWLLRHAEGLPGWPDYEMVTLLVAKANQAYWTCTGGYEKRCLAEMKAYRRYVIVK